MSAKKITVGVCVFLFVLAVISRRKQLRYFRYFLYYPDRKYCFAIFTFCLESTESTERTALSVLSVLSLFCILRRMSPSSPISTFRRSRSLSHLSTSFRIRLAPALLVLYCRFSASHLELTSRSAATTTSTTLLGTRDVPTLVPRAALLHRWSRRPSSTFPTPVRILTFLQCLGIVPPTSTLPSSRHRLPPIFPLS